MLLPDAVDVTFTSPIVPNWGVTVIWVSTGTFLAPFATFIVIANGPDGAGVGVGVGVGVSAAGVTLASGAWTAGLSPAVGVVGLAPHAVSANAAPAAAHLEIFAISPPVAQVLVQGCHAGATVPVRSPSRSCSNRARPPLSGRGPRSWSGHAPNAQAGVRGNDAAPDL
ncbi:hypothetical protein GCM10027418_09260 [Mariniluteicoccus endophyticus]